MDLQKTEKNLKSLLKGEFSSLHIDFNEHSSVYKTAGEAINDDHYDDVNWVSMEEKSLAIKNNSVWTFQWYPHTPGSYEILAGSTLASVIEASLK